MGEQVIISISREYGSGGHEIAKRISEMFHLPLYDRNLLDEIAKSKNGNQETLAKYDEAKRKGLTRSVRGFTTDMAENVAQLQFEYLREKASAGESFVIVGRCAETVLRDFEGLISIFVMGDYEAKLDRVMEKRGFNAKEAALAIIRHDKSRKLYHNRYSDFKWGDSRNYELCINSSKLGVEKTAEALKGYIEARIEEMKNK